MDHSGNNLFDGHISSTQVDKGRLSALSFLTDVIGTAFGSKDPFIDVDTVK